MRKILSIFLVTVLFSQVCFGSAEHYLRRLATKGAIGRMIISIPVIAGGYHIYNLGKDISEGKSHTHDTVVQALDGDADRLKSTGALLSSVGILSLLLPSTAEKELKNIRKIKNPKHRESASSSALIKLANRGRTSRYICGGIFTYISIMPGSLSQSRLYLIGGILCFVFKTPAERYLEKLQNEKLLSTKHDNIIDPHLYFAFNPYNNLYSVNLQMKF